MYISKFLYSYIYIYQTPQMLESFEIQDTPVISIYLKKKSGTSPRVNVTLGLPLTTRYRTYVVQVQKVFVIHLE